MRDIILPSNLLKRATLALMLLLAGLLLAACSQPTLQAPTGDARHDYVASVPVTTADTREAVEARHNADVMVWRPEAGFAVLGLREGSSGLATLGKRSANQDAILAPEANASGISAWAGGVSAWAGGVSAWAGGVSAWAGGTANPFPGNETVWSQIGIGAAQDLSPNDGAGVKIAVIDTGIDLDHSGFTGRLAPASEWKDFVDGDAFPDEVPGDYYGHGTAVAGIILQVAPNATILPIRVLGPNGAGDITHVTQAIDHAVAQGVGVINLSLGSNSDVRALQDVISYAMGQGITVVSSSGNTGDTNVTYPAANAPENRIGKQALGVGSVDALDVKSPFSTYGAALELLAPGQGITTLYPDEKTAVVSGTSFAAPWVTGTIALARADGSSPNNLAGNTTNSARNIDLVNPGYGGLLGAGRLDTLAMYQKSMSF